MHIHTFLKHCELNNILFTGYNIAGTEKEVATWTLHNLQYLM